MISAPDRALMRWMFTFCGVVALLIVFGGFVRLTRSGLSIVEWKPVTGVLPPIGERAWRRVFSAYQRSPEFIKVNSAMTLAEFRRIFLIEWVHRLLARLAGFVYAVPFFYFLLRRRIPRQDLPIYLAMGSLFVLQALAGWIMVASGLEDRPSVSHINLAVHLVLAFTLLALALWCALDHRFGCSRPSLPDGWSAPSVSGAVFVAVLVVQIAYGGFTAGLKAGHVSDTWPLMFGKLIPSGLFGSLADVFRSPATIVFIHRWFAFVVLVAAVTLVVAARRRRSDAGVRWGVVALVAAVCGQILLGIATVLSSVNAAVALCHQGTAVAVFCIGVFILHRLRALDLRALDAPVVAGVVDSADPRWVPRADELVVD